MYAYMYFTAVNMIPVRRLACPDLDRFPPFTRRFARQERQLFPQIRDLLVFRKPIEA
jgi:hypothetical protein